MSDLTKINTQTMLSLYKLNPFKNWMKIKRLNQQIKYSNSKKPVKNPENVLFIPKKSVLRNLLSNR